MALTPKPFRELLDMEFIIPAYQRGYRWDNEQVETLLDDLFEFIKDHSGSHKDPNDYYCLQPVAVVPNPEKPNDKSFIVVDGQQRLTTIYLLLHYLHQKSDYDYPIYKLRFDSRDVQDNYISKCLFMQEEGRPESASNIDIFYLEKAYKTITDWFAADPMRAQRKSKFRDLFTLVPLDEEPVNDVKVIWYVINHKGALEAFRRLNYGKIPLTSAELVKALLLQGDDAGNAGRHGTGAPYRRALEWDEMEHSLQNPYLWSMLSDNKSDSSRIEIILDFVADEFNTKMKDKEGKVPFVRKDKRLLDTPDARDYFNYNVINEYIRRNGNGAIEDVWNKMRSLFNLITNWYDRHDWYHLIGLLRILPRDRKSRRDQFKLLHSLAIDEKGEPVDRPKFTAELKARIANEVRLDDEIENLNYNDNKKEIIRILKLLNVREAMKDHNEDTRFAFHLFDHFNVTSLEHIHPQNITTNASYDDFRLWCERRAEDFGKLQAIDLETIIRNRRKKKSRVQDEAQTETEMEEIPVSIEEIETLKNEIEKAIATLKKLTANKKLYADPDNKPTLDVAAKKLDTAFGEFSGIDEKELHSIANLALVDKDTNSCLQNYFLDHKRELLMRRHNPGPGRKPDTYAPPATRKVFAKDYSRSHPGDMRLWTKTDRENYLEAIKEAYDFFIK